MNKLNFKTNINCNSCVSRVSPILDSEDKINNWEVNLESADRILSVESESLNATEISNVVSKAGFTAEILD